MIYFILSAILLYNVVLSQIISPLYGKFIQNEKNSVGPILKSIQSRPEFNKLYLIYKNKYGVKIEYEVFSEKKKDELFVSDLEKILEQNLQSRDVNYNLSQVLKKTGGDGVRYLIHAKQIDTEIN